MTSENILSRRGFVRATAAVAAATALTSGGLLRRVAFAHGDRDRLLPRNRLGIQLFTIRDQVANVGFEAVFRELARQGYAEVEFAGYTQGAALPPITVREIRH